MPVSDSNNKKNVPTDSPLPTTTPEAVGLEALCRAFSGESAGDIAGSIIENQESRGQQALVASAQLPTRGLDPDKCAELGIVIGKKLDDDDLFTAVQLPEGIVKEGSDHALWSYLKDTAGNQIASIFYKAVSYDRDAFITFK